MNAFQKTLVTSIIVIALGASIYERQKILDTLEKQEACQRELKKLGESLLQLQRERDAATNQLTITSKEIAQLKSQLASGDVLRLRGEIGVLRQQLALTEANSSNSNSMFNMLNDPAMQDFLHHNNLQWVQSVFGGIFKELKLTPEQTDKVSGLMAKVMQANAKKLSAIQRGTVTPEEMDRRIEGWNEDLYKELQPIVGEAGVARIKQFREELPAMATAELLNGRLGANQLSEEQKNQLVKVVKAEPFGLTRGIIGLCESAFFGSQEDIDNHLLDVEQSDQRILDQAKSFLTTEQWEGLNAFLTNSVNARIAQANALIPKH